MWRTSNFPICSPSASSFSPSSCRGPIKTLPQLAACLPSGQNFGAGKSGRLWFKQWVANHYQKEAREMAGGHTALGCWDVALACSCRHVAAGTACGNLVLVSQSPWKRKTFPVCNSAWTAHLHTLYRVKAARLKRWDERFGC